MSYDQQAIDSFMAKGKGEMEDSIEHLHKELVKIRTGKASPAMLNDLLVSYYGNPTPMNQVANVGTQDSRTLVIQPYDKSALSDIEKAIFEANLGLTPQNDGDIVRINIPPLTEDRRKTLVKHAKHLGEETKVSLRSARHKLMDFIKNAVKEGYPEDAGKRMEATIDKMTHDYGAKVDKLVEAKTKDIMTV
jgi:ribosome recycling factor